MAKVGDLVWSDYFQAWLEIVKINSNTDWYFQKDGRGPVLKAQTPLQHFKLIKGDYTPERNIMEERELTYGEKAVGLTFNPSNNEMVNELKQAAAKFIDLCDFHRNATPGLDPEVKRMMSIAITEAQTAQMWAVKAATWSN